MTMHKLGALAALLALLLVTTTPVASAQADVADGAANDAPAIASAPRGWPVDVVRAAEALPVQDGGRIKPLHTYAGFTLLRFNGKRSLETLDGTVLTPVEWLLDVFLFPELAKTDPVFLVQNGEVAEAIGLPSGNKGRTRYSLDDLRPGLSQLFQLGHEYSGIEPKQRSTVQEQVVVLASNVNGFLRLLSCLEWAREPLPVGAGPSLEQIFAGRASVTFSEIVSNGVSLAQLQQELARAASMENLVERDSLAVLLTKASQRVSGTSVLALFPPSLPLADAPSWHTPSDLLARSMQGAPVSPVELEALWYLEQATVHRDDPTSVGVALDELLRCTTSLAAVRGELDAVELELTYYKLDLLTWSLAGFLLAFVATALLWLKPRMIWMHRLAWVSASAGTLLLVTVIVLRCVIRSRPPVSTLYETVLFVTATGALVALFLEAVNKKRVALSATAVLGTVGLFLANGYEMLDKQDTMPSLVAVLDTNFWLATHVTTITLGYSAGMLAALLGTVYVLGKAVGWHRNETGFYRDITRMTYGVLCFAAILSIVGTILGGIWANDSWGRFWGWDPKENGALMICLWQVAMLHGRMGGFLRDLGLAVAAAFGGTIIAFSWWGVNLLGVGLHSYGFTSGIHSALWGYYLLQWSVVALGLALAWRARSKGGSPPGPGPDKASLADQAG